MRLTMRAAALAAALAVFATAPGAQTLDQSDVALRTAQNLDDLCKARGPSPSAEKARSFCHGYISGAMHLHRVLVGRDGFTPIACPHRGVTRREMAEVFVGWAAGRRDLAGMSALDGLMRAAQATWPCKRA